MVAFRKTAYRTLKGLKRDDVLTMQKTGLYMCVYKREN